MTTIKYFSQFRQDEFVDKVVFNNMRGGFFVDIGAHDGLSLSNSLFFEKYRKFNGLCIEPNPNVYTKLKAHRKCMTLNVCITETEQLVKFQVVEGYAQMLSGIVDKYHRDHIERIDNYIMEYGGTKAEIIVKGIPLQNIDLLNGISIDFLSIDTEGNELGILRSIDFKKNYITCLSVENNYNDEKIEQLMKENEFLKVYRLGDDDIYLKKSKYSIGFRVRRRIFLWLSKRKKKHF